jgi:hypothetical protein
MDWASAAADGERPVERLVVLRGSNENRTPACAGARLLRSRHVRNYFALLAGGVADGALGAGAVGAAVGAAGLMPPVPEPVVVLVEAGGVDVLLAVLVVEPPQ